MAAALAGIWSPAQAEAQVFISGTTSGCFYLWTNPGSCSSSSYSGLSFSGGSFSGMAMPGNVYSLNTFSDYLGQFSLHPQTVGYFGEPLRFRLSVAFSSPTTASPNPVNVVADFDGDVIVNDRWDDLDIDFNNSWRNVNYDGAPGSNFNLRVNDVNNISRGESRLVTGAIDCGNRCGVDVPEPSSFGLLMVGMAGVFAASRRRRFGV